jgi:hypothetical protein
VSRKRRGSRGLADPAAPATDPDDVTPDGAGPVGAEPDDVTSDGPGPVAGEPGPLGPDGLGTGPVEPGEVRDALPADLDVTGDLGPYEFPDNARRRLPGVLYLAAAAVCLTVRLAAGSGAVLVNDGWFVAAAVFLAFGAYSFVAGQPTVVGDTEALVAATRAVGFPVGHASAQMAWRGLRSRPTWRILVYSAEDPPAQRGLVLVDAVDGTVLEQFVESNPEDWSAEDWADLRGPG